jgi:hypothetical protein
MSRLFSPHALLARYLGERATQQLRLTAAEAAGESGSVACLPHGTYGCVRPIPSQRLLWLAMPL